MEENKDIHSEEAPLEEIKENPETETASEVEEESSHENTSEEINAEAASEETAKEALPVASEVMEEPKKKTKKEKKAERIQQLLEYKPGNDIKYRGPVGIRGLRIIGWVLVILSTLTLSLTFLLMTKLVSFDDPGITAAYVICSYCGAAAIPCFMLARFAMIFQKKKSFKGMLLAYGSIAALIVFIYCLIYFHYAIEVLEVILGKTYDEAKITMEGFIHKIANKKLCFNVFLDMFLWSWYFAAVEYEIKKKSIWKSILQKLIASIPFIYVCFWFVIKLLFAFNKMDINGAYLAVIPTTTPLIFLAFISISGFIKRRKKLYLRIGGTEEGYKEYLKTNVNSLHFSKVAALCFFLAGVMEFVFMFILILIAAIKTAEGGVVDTAAIESIVKITGTGGCFSYMIFAPCILLFSYTRVYKNDKIDLLVPIISIILIVFILIEVSYSSLISWIKYLKG